MKNFLNRIKNTVAVKKVEVRGSEISYLPSSDIEEYRFSTYEKKEPETLDWIDEYVKDGDIFFDIGANVGIYSLYASIRVGQKGRVYSFEPESSNFVSLNRNIMANDFGQNIVAVPFALCEELKVDWFHLSGKDFFTGKNIHSEQSNDKYRSGSAMHSFGEDSNLVAAFHKYVCLGVNLDWLIGQELFTQPNHIKLDVDSIELSIIRGAVEVLMNPALKTILVEINQGDDEIIRIFEKNGFQMREIESASGNCLFVR